MFLFLKTVLLIKFFFFTQVVLLFKVFFIWKYIKQYIFFNFFKFIFNIGTSKRFKNKKKIQKKNLNFLKIFLDHKNKQCHSVRGVRLFSLKEFFKKIKMMFSNVFLIILIFYIKNTCEQIF
jgi:hypothetical protein